MWEVGLKMGYPEKFPEPKFILTDKSFDELVRKIAMDQMDYYNYQDLDDETEIIRQHFYL